MGDDDTPDGRRPWSYETRMLSEAQVIARTIDHEPWTFVGDVGSTSQPFDPHSPHNYVTNAQASAVVRVGEQWLWMGNQWVTAGVRNRGLLYWSVLRFDGSGDVRQLEWAPDAKVRL